MSLESSLSDPFSLHEKRLKLLHRAAADPMTRMAALSKTVHRDNLLSSKTKGLIALGMAVQSGSDGSMAEITSALVKAGLSRAELVEACGVFLQMGGHPGQVKAGQVLEFYDNFCSQLAV